ncbi:MAG: flavin reductase family protein [Firmicutes bacterium]|nr:flavin reductase family protein [Bacillota bacterium]
MAAKPVRKSTAPRTSAEKPAEAASERLVWKPGTLEAPLPPVLVTCGTMEHPNALTIAWSGIVNSDPAMTYISVRPERYSFDIIRKSGEFVINLPTQSLLRAVDYCGVRSGRDTDKIADCHLDLLPGAKVSAPLILQSPLQLECRVRRELPLGSHHMFLAEILAVRVDSRLLDDTGRLALERAGLIAYVHGQYFSLGKVLGKFGYSVRKKR